MKTKRIYGLILTVCLVSALVMAEVSKEQESEQKRKGADVSASRQRDGSMPGRVSPSRRGAPADRRQAYHKRLAGQMAKHKEALAELEAIKKIAEEEGATRTAEALGKMIDKKDAEFRQKMEQFERQRRERSKRIQQRAEKQAQKKTAETTKKKAAEEK